MRGPGRLTSCAFTDIRSGMAAKTLGQRIRAARDAAGFTVGVAFAEMIGVKPHTLWRYENDQIQPSAKVLLNIAQACDVSMEQLLEAQKKKARSGKAA